MSNRNIKAVLDEALEQEIPASEIKLWPAVRSALGTGNHSLTREGEKMKPINPSRWRQRAVFVTVAAACVLAAGLMTPQGRAFAQEVLRFFTRIDQDEFYMEPSDLTFEETTPFHPECGISIAPRCSVEQVRSMVAFEIKELGIIPEGMRLVGATGGPDYIELKYEYADPRNGTLSVVAEATGNPTPFGTGIVARSANIESVLVGDLPGEFYTGALIQDDEGNVKWTPDDPQATLRWEDGGSTYTLFYYSPAFPLTKEELVSLAANMTLEPVGP